MFRKYGMVACALVSLANAAHATPIEIINSSFEDDALTDGGFRITSPTGWVANSNAGYQNPASSVFPSVPDGQQTGFVGSGSAGSAFTGSLRQDLDAQVLANTRYTLSAAIGRRADGFSLGDFVLELLAGDTVLASGSFTDADVAAGAFRTLSVEFTSVRAIEEQLGIRLRTTYGGGNYRQVNIDDVALDATAFEPPVETPEPAALGLFGLGIIALGSRRRKAGRGSSASR